MLPILPTITASDFGGAIRTNRKAFSAFRVYGRSVLCAQIVRNTQAGDPVAMAEAFAPALRAGAMARTADPMEPRETAAPATPAIGKAWL